MRRLTTALLLASALAIAACGGSDDDTAEASGPEGSSTEGSGPAELDFVAPDVRGGQVVGADLAGQDLVIWFWAPW